MTQNTEPLVTLAGPSEHKDVTDLSTGLRFIEGKATNVPLSLAEEVARTRQGYFIEGAHKAPRVRRHDSD
jgi:hypothetical protein